MAEIILAVTKVFALLAAAVVDMPLILAVFQWKRAGDPQLV